MRSGVLDNICDTVSVTDVNTSFSELMIGIPSSSTSSASFGPPPVILASLRLQSTRGLVDPLELFHFFFTSFISRLFRWMELMFYITSFHSIILFISALWPVPTNTPPTACRPQWVYILPHLSNLFPNIFHTHALEISIMSWIFRMTIPCLSSLIKDTPTLTCFYNYAVRMEQILYTVFPWIVAPLE